MWGSRCHHQYHHLIPKGEIGVESGLPWTLPAGAPQAASIGLEESGVGGEVPNLHATHPEGMPDRLIKVLGTAGRI